MNFIIALIFGIVEGITEWLPISSTGHLILVEEFFPFQNMKNADEFFEFFNVVIQLGAIMAVVVLFWNKLWPFSKNEENFIKKDTFVMWYKIVIACVPAAIIGLAFDEMFEKYFYNAVSVSIALVLVGFIFIIIENINKKEPIINSISEITYKTAIIIGMFQLIAAVFPGVSRSGATIIGALLIGVSRKTAAEFTFFLAVPVMFGASLLKLVKFGIDFTPEQLIIVAIGCISAFLVSIFIIKFLLNYIKKHDFKVFAYYRIILGICVLGLFLGGLLNV